MQIDLNADVGEGLEDALLIPFLSSVNIACGGHAGDEQSMEAAIALALRHQVRIGAHPSYPDRAHFGRLAMEMDPRELEEALVQQIEQLRRVGQRHGAVLSHIKPHGALYHSASQSEPVASAVVSAVCRVDSSMVLVGPPDSLLLRAGEERGLRVAGEAFADRRYLPNGHLAHRGEGGALLTDPSAAARQALQIVRDRCVTTADGSRFPLAAQTLCVHGDTPGAADIAHAVRDQLERAGIEVVAFASSKHG